jgi:hypothetical protein
LTAVNRGLRRHAQHAHPNDRDAGLQGRIGAAMPEQVKGPAVDAADVEAAIALVLQAERDARDSVQRCAVEAEAIVEQAHEHARQTARRAAHRSVRVQRWYAAMLRRQLDQIERQQVAIVRQSLAASDDAMRRRVIEALAAQLTGART